MKLIDPALTLHGSGPTIEILPIDVLAAPVRPRWWRHPWRAWTLRNLPDTVTPRFRLRVTSQSGEVVLDVDDYALNLILLYSGQDQ